jgi:hypothetical protein
MRKITLDVRVSLIIVVVFLTAFLAILDKSLTSIALPNDERVSIHNISPCLEPDWRRVEKLSEEDAQWICADVISDSTLIDLDLYIDNRENGSSVYFDTETFSSGSIAWIIYPPIPPGKYNAKITGLRGPIYASFEFEVVENSNK